MSEETFDFILGILLIVFGVLIMIYKIRNPLKKDENEFGKAAHYQIIILGIFLIVFGIYMI
jgi:uncharacterized membrane protein